MTYEQMSDNYYATYKEGLRESEEYNSLYLLNKIIKILFITLSLILTLLISIYLKNNFSDMTMFDIREEYSTKENITSQDLTLLIELLQTQIDTKNI